MVRWYHAIFSAYGHWLPNDPRGSWSDFVYAYDLFRAGGAATTVTDRRSYAHDPHDKQNRLQTKQKLLFPPARFDAAARKSIAIGVGRACEEFEFVLRACAIGHDHVHLIAGRSERSVEQTIAVLKSRATAQMRTDETHPLQAYRNTKDAIPTPWSEGCWKVFIQDVEQLRAAVNYVERHPMKEGLAKQEWSFQKPIDF